MKLFAVFFSFIAFPLFAAQSVVILPFNNESKTQHVYWLGEGFAESLTEEMLFKNVYVIQRPERRAAYDTLKLPYVGHLSRATMLKIGSNLGVDYIVFGEYSLDQNNLKVEAQVIQTSNSRLSTPISATATLDQLYVVQDRLKSGLKQYFAKQKLELTEGKPQGPSVPLHAYEQYI
jgi:TolB-like protein